MSNDELTPETPRQRFLRNHQENIRNMRATLIRAERDNSPYLETYRQIVQAWELIGQLAESEENTK